VLEDLITYSDLVRHRTQGQADLQLFSAEEPVAPALPPGSALSRSGVLTYHPIDDGSQPGSSRTRIQILDTSKMTPSAVGVPEEGGKRLTVPEMSTSATTSATMTPLASSVIAEESVPLRSFTTDDDLELLFDPSIIPPSLSEIGEEYHVGAHAEYR
jgi:hypothetical protein